MGELLVRIASQRGWVDAFIGEEAIDQQARPRAALAIDEAQPPARQLPKTANAFGVAARQDKSLVAVDEPDQPVAPRVKQAPERREIARLVKARSDVEACGIDPAGRELLEGVQTPHEGKVERQRPRVRQRLAQRRQRQIVTRRDREPNAGR